MNQTSLEITIEELAKEGFDKYVFVDVREPAECMLFPVSEIERIEIPLSQFTESSLSIDDDKQYVFYCAKGVRSFEIVNFFHSKDKTNTMSLIDGIDAIKRHFS